MSLPRVTVASGAHANFRSIDATEMKFLFPDRKCPHPYAKMSPSKLNFREKKRVPIDADKELLLLRSGEEQRKKKKTLGRDTIPAASKRGSGALAPGGLRHFGCCARSTRHAGSRTRSLDQNVRTVRVCTGKWVKICHGPWHEICRARGLHQGRRQ